MSIFSDIVLNTLDTLLYASQRNWVLGDSPLKLCVKVRQTGFSWANDLRSVLLVTAEDARFDDHIMRPSKNRFTVHASRLTQYAIPAEIACLSLPPMLYFPPRVQFAEAGYF